ncbi:MAG: hypothetical protein KBE72_07405, partial [Syntrophaceae bacterium]|nr:hypothetical protein [Syntrophaceae bacterium]
RSSFLFLPFSVQKVGVCNVLPTVCEGAFDRLFSGAKINRWVGNFQVATGGGFWVAAGGRIPIFSVLHYVFSIKRSNCNFKPWTTVDCLPNCHRLYKLIVPYRITNFMISVDPAKS